MASTLPAFNPKLDLQLERTANVPRELVWKAWTEPEQLKKWFTPDPWKTIEAELDLRPGGMFRTVMQSPEGENFPNAGCFLEIIPNEKLAWTSALKPGFRPASASELVPGDILFTAVLMFESTPAGGTKYTAHVMHGKEEDQKKHAEMGFEGGWGAAWDQLVAMVKGERK